jgi:hypothetical protein
MASNDNLNQARLFKGLFTVRQIAAPSSERASETCLTSCLFNWLQAISEDGSLAVNLLVTVSEISCESRDGSRFTKQAKEMDRDVPRKFVDPVLDNNFAFGRGLSFGEFGATVAHPANDGPGQ